MTMLDQLDRLLLQYAGILPADPTISQRCHHQLSVKSFESARFPDTFDPTSIDPLSQLLPLHKPPFVTTEHAHICVAIKRLLPSEVIEIDVLGKVFIKGHGDTLSPNVSPILIQKASFSQPLPSLSLIQETIAKAAPKPDTAASSTAIPPVSSASTTSPGSSVPPAQPPHVTAANLFVQSLDQYKRKFPELFALADKPTAGTVSAAFPFLYNLFCQGYLLPVCHKTLRSARQVSPF